MKKEKFFNVLLGVGVMGCLIHPAMIIVVAVGVWGLSKFGTSKEQA